MMIYLVACIRRHLWAIVGLFWVIISAQAGESFKIGVYDAKPVAYRAADGSYRGLAIEVLEEVARKNDWSLEYVAAPLPELLARVEHGGVDIVVGVADVRDRSRHYLMSRETLVSNWGVVYGTPQAKIETFLDLAGKRIAMMGGSNQSVELKRVLHQFNVSYSEVPAIDYGEALRLVEEGKADAGLADRFSIITRDESQLIVPTPIMFNPVELRYAVRAGLDGVLAKIDDEVRSEKLNPHSLFNNFFDRSLGAGQHLFNYVSAKWLAIGVVVLVVLLSIISVFLRREVARRTGELRQKTIDLRKARYELEQDKEFLTALLHSLQNGVMACDADGRLTVFNRAARDFQGYKESELPKERWADIYNLYDDDGRLRLGIERNPLYLAWRGATLNDLQVTLIPPGGEPHTAMVSGQPFYGADGKKLGAVVSYHDVTEYKRVEGLLLRRNAEFEAVFKSIQDVVIYVNRSNRIMMVNPAAQELFGYSQKELIGSEVGVLYAKDRQYAENGVDENLWRNNGLIPSVACSRKDGSTFIGETTSGQVMDAAGNKLGKIIVVRDITARLAAEMEVRRSNRALKAIKAANEAIAYAQNEEQLYADICRVCVGEAGYRMAWIGLAQHDSEKRIVPAASAGFDDNYLETAKITWDENDTGRGPAGRALRTGQPAIVRFVDSDPSFMPWRAAAEKRGYRSVVAIPLFISGRPYGVLVIYATAADAFDEEEVRLLGDLASDVIYGVGALRAHHEREQLQRQLRQAQKMEAVGQLTGGIAHDFNNILASVLGYADLALFEKSVQQDERVKMYMEEVINSGKRARDLVAKLLAFSRGGNEPVRPMPVGVLLKETLQMLRSTLPATIKTDLLIDPELPSVMTDSVQFQQVILNLCINARDAMSEGGVIGVTAKVAVTTAICTSCHTPFYGDFVEISVGDTGSGIDADLLSRIFDPFFTTKEVGKGSGMGLSVVHGIVHSMGGHLLVESEPGKGAVFKIYLRRAEGKPNAQTDDLVRNPEYVELQGRILVVDDDIAVARMMEHTLKQRGLEVEVVTEPKRAIELFELKTDAFNLVITDYQMPGMTGVELASQLLKMQPSLPVVLYTAYSDVTIENRSRDAGVAKVLHKPVDIHELLRTLDELLHSEEKVIYLNNPRLRH
ncbi:MAG: PAS domain S-box protein [Gammaproteobacteria bacterium]|nr:PAS domain S-box protein [Gammaproteobacteria bacterium]